MAENNSEIAARLSFISRITKIAIWTAIGLALAGLERLIPTPVPWIKIGLGNGAALIVLYLSGLKPALFVNLARIIAMALFLGSWSNPTFYLSLGGGIISVLVMALVRNIGRGWVGPIGVSAAGAWTHMIIQFGLASLLIVRHSSLMLLAGPSLIAAVFSGIIIGWIANELIRRIPRSLLAID